ncbi:hypothetical protein HOM50_05025 [bacterium]|jgi:hypothetical protein|nr:hypothetical protein [bacterium]MBT5015744.1 hypothetical protein [bacterium]
MKKAILIPILAILCCVTDQAVAGEGELLVETSPVIPHADRSPENLYTYKAPFSVWLVRTQRLLNKVNQETQELVSLNREAESQIDFDLINKQDSDSNEFSTKKIHPSSLQYQRLLEKEKELRALNTMMQEIKQTVGLPAGKTTILSLDLIDQLDAAIAKAVSFTPAALIIGIKSSTRGLSHADNEVIKDLVVLDLEKIEALAKATIKSIEGVRRRLSLMVGSISPARAESIVAAATYRNSVQELLQVIKGLQTMVELQVTDEDLMELP